MAETIRLLGRDAAELEDVKTATLGTSIALALSRGRFPKGYPHTDPNEDACLAATDGVVTLLAVADGHRGAEAAERAIASLRQSDPVLAAGSSDPVGAATQAMLKARRAVAGLGSRSASRTALTIAVLGPKSSGLSQAGDTAAFLTDGRRARLLRGPTPFLGGTAAEDPPVGLGFRRLRSGETLVLASDGLLDFLGTSHLRVVAELCREASALQCAEEAIGQAFAGGAGDNVAVAVFRA